MDTVEITNKLNDVPVFLLWFAFVGGLIVTATQIVKFLFSVLVQAKLDIRLTQEIFFRFSDWGECIFPNVVLISRHKSSEIKKVNFRLTKKPNPSSTLELNINIEPRLFGERVHAEGNAFAENFFYTSSPAFFISPETPTRMVILAIVQGSGVEFNKIMNEFNEKAYDLKNTYYSRAVNDAESVKPELQLKTESLTRDSASKILDSIHLKPGDYELAVNVTYKGLQLLSWEKVATSKISFSVEENVREQFRIKLEQLLKTALVNIFSDKIEAYNYPEYYPINVSEF